jgi:hypothetical protein
MKVADEGELRDACGENEKMMQERRTSTVHIWQSFCSGALLQFPRASQSQFHCLFTTLPTY